jgi:hypothetical protein
MIVIGWVKDLTDVAEAEGRVARNDRGTRKPAIFFWRVLTSCKFLAVTGQF